MKDIFDKKTRKHLLQILACIVVFVTVYLLVLPAVAIDSNRVLNEPGFELETEGNESGEVVSNETETEYIETEESAILEVEKTVDTNRDNTDNTPDEIIEEDLTYPAQTFNQSLYDSIVYVEAPEGAFPQDTKMVVKEVEADEQLIASIENQLDYEKVNAIKALDISFIYKDKELDPLIPIKVSISSAFIDENEDEAKMFHIKEEEDPVEISSAVSDQETIETIIEENSEAIADTYNEVYEASESNTISFDTESFSVYAIVYTVDFHFETQGNTYDTSIPGGTYISLKELISSLNLEETDPDTFIDDIESVSFYDNSLVYITKVEEETKISSIIENENLSVEYSSELSEEDINKIREALIQPVDYVLLSLKPFDSKETLTITMKNGDEFTVKVTDGRLLTYVISAQGETYEVEVTYDDNAGIPDDAVLSAVEVLNDDPDYEQLVKDASTAAGINEYDFVRVFDISITADNEKIEPKQAVSVKIRYLDEVLNSDSSLKVVHFGEESTEVLSSDTSVNEEGNVEVVFETESFSNFVRIKELVYKEIGEGLITYFSFDNINGHSDLNGYSADGENNAIIIPQNGNTTEDTDSADGHNGTFALKLANSQYYVVNKSDGVTPILDGNLNNNKLTVSYWGKSTGNGSNWSFFAYTPYNNTGEYIGNADQTENSLNYIGVVQNNAATQLERYNSYNGYGRGTPSANYSLASANNAWHQYVAVFDTGKISLYVDGELKKEVENNASLQDLFSRGSVFQVGRGNWQGGEYFKGQIDELGIYNYAMNAKEVDHLYKVYTQEPQTAVKMSISDVVTMQGIKEESDTDGGEHLKVIIYKKIVNSDNTYSLYALTGDGSLTKIEEYGDLIGTRSGYLLGWDMIRRKDNSGTDTDYFDFVSTETGKYLLPWNGGIVKDDDLSQDYDLGIILTGWKNGDYGTSLDHWDSDSKQWYTVGINNKVPVSKTDNSYEEFLFAVINPVESEATDNLDPVNTVDSVSKGITIKMFDFGQGKNDRDEIYYKEGQGFRVHSMTDVIGNDEYVTGNNNGGMITYNLANLILQNDFPTFTWKDGGSSTTHSLNEIFNETYQKSGNANNLFIESVYEETGYFEYDSAYNHAFLNSDTFEVYRQISTPNGAGGNAQYKGNFLPYDTLVGKTISNEKRNQYDTLGNLLPDVDPRYNGDLYYINNPNYFFGMSLESDFYQPNGGVDKRGNQVVYEFSGDDDVWVYIDDVLILDLGGIHGSVKGSINFSTGAVHIGAANSRDTTLKQLFINAYSGTVSDEELNNLLNSKFTGDTFKNYTNHNMKMFYMERGAGASNLHIRFNLPTMKAGTFAVEKELGENVQDKYTAKKYPFQLFVGEGNEPIDLSRIGEEAYPIVYAGYEDSAAALDIDPNDSTIFYLKPGQVAIFELIDSDEQYYVKEIGVDSAYYNPIVVNDTTATVVNDTVVVSPSTIENRARVVFENKPTDWNKQNLLIKKVVDPDVLNSDAEFEFYIKLQGHDGTLIPYSLGDYYLIKEIDGAIHYFTYGVNGPEDEGTNEVICSRSGNGGSINHIPAGYTVLIKDILAGTQYQITETTMFGYELDRIITNTSSDAELLENATGMVEFGDSDALVTVVNKPAYDELKILKIGVDGEPLKGAEFTLFKEETALENYISDEQGVIFFGRLGIGEYTLKETKAPAGYNMLSEAITIKVSAVDLDLDGKDDEIVYTSVFSISGEELTISVRDNVAILQIENIPGYELPMTGGTGTTLNKLIGISMILFAGVYLVTKKRKD